MPGKCWCLWYPMEQARNMEMKSILLQLKTICSLTAYHEPWFVEIPWMPFASVVISIWIIKPRCLILPTWKEKNEINLWERYALRIFFAYLLSFVVYFNVSCGQSAASGSLLFPRGLKERVDINEHACVFCLPKNILKHGKCLPRLSYMIFFFCYYSHRYMHVHQQVHLYLHM